MFIKKNRNPSYKKSGSDIISPVVGWDELDCGWECKPEASIPSVSPEDTSAIENRRMDAAQEGSG